MDRKRPAEKVIPTSFRPLNICIRIRSAGVFTVLLSSYNGPEAVCAAKVIPTPLTFTCVQTTDQIEIRSAGVCTVLSSGKSYSYTFTIYMCSDHRTYTN